MKIIKFAHACFVVEENGRSLVVDPGNWTDDLVVPESVDAVVVTHEHPDHLDKNHLQAIVDKNPDAVIIGHNDVVSQLKSFKTQVAVPNEGIKIGNFELEFFGGQHATITESMPPVPNLGIMINEKLYYPGDSFVVPDSPVEVLALPVSAPWMKFSEAADFLEAVKPKLVFPTHDAILSDSGKSLIDRLATQAAEKIGASYQRLHAPLEV